MYASLRSISRLLLAAVVLADAGGIAAAQPDVPPPPPPVADAPPPSVASGIRGRIIDADTGDGIPGIAIELVDEAAADAVVTDANGGFELRLVPGTYTLRVTGELYQRHRIRGVVVRHGITTLDVKLSAEAIEELVVTAPPDTASDAVQVVRRRKRATVSDAISAEQMQRSPDSNASDAAKRMVGATIQDGRYVVIRGLGGRYSLTLLNGVPLPSPDPDVPAAPLDLFPAALLANLTVNKTFSPDMPGNFAGGALSIETRSFPAKFTLKIKGGFTGDSESSFRALHGYRGGSYDFLGFDDGTRALPDAIPSTELAGDPSLTAEEIDAQAASFASVWSLAPDDVGPNGSLAVTVGDTVAVRDQRLGYFASANYGHSYVRRITHIQRVGEADGDGGFLPSVLQLDEEQGTEQATLGGLVTAGWSPARAHTVGLVALYTHGAENTGSQVLGVDNSTTNVDRTRLRFLQREMAFAQLVGEHGLADGRAVVGWQANVAHVAQHEPDTRDLLRTQIPDGRYAIDSSSGSAERLYSDLGDTSGGGGLDVTVPLGDLKLKAGASVLRSRRTYQARRFHFSIFGDDAFLDPDAAFDPEHAGTSMFFFETTLPSDGYVAERDVTSAYLLADVAVWEPLRVVAGARFEQSALDLGLESEIDLGAPPMELGQRTDRDVLPSINAVFGVSERSNLRAAYGMTVARPNFREVAPALYYDYVRRRAIGGNPDLRETTIHNLDLRWETFLGDTEVLAASVFYKQFVDPIEQTVEDAGDGTNVGFANAEGARSYGVELEARVTAGRIAPALSAFSLGGNLALIGSQIDVAGSERPLQGQSPFVANLSLGYEARGLGTQVDVLYNVFGRRIEEVGTGGSGNIYEEPFHRLDLTVSQKLPRHLKLKLAGTNLLNQRVVRSQNDVEILAYQVGVSVVASMELSVE